MADKKTTVKEKVEEAPKATSVSYYEAVGRRKEATARVRLYVSGSDVEKGAIIVNGKPVEQYFPGEVYKRLVWEPLRTTNAASRFSVTIKTRGGGLAGQLSAVVLGLSRALEKADKEKMRPILKKRGFLTRDARIKERRKAGLAGKARAKKQSPKR
jgi:small subunit ribosomal protein S9